jgi:hypothetical protein
MKTRALPMVAVMPIRPLTCSVLAVAGVGCLLFILTVRGASDWSDSLGVIFYGVVIGAFGLSVVGGVAALLSRTLGTGQRLFCVAVGVVVPVLFAYATWAILDFVSHMN